MNRFNHQAPYKNPNKRLLVSVRWFAACGLPREHILHVLGLEEHSLPERVRQKLAKPFGRGRRPTCPTPQCVNGRRGEGKLLGMRAAKATRIAELGYGASTIARLLGANIDDVRHFLKHARWDTPPVSPWYSTDQSEAWRYGTGERPTAGTPPDRQSERAESTRMKEAPPGLQPGGELGVTGTHPDRTRATSEDGREALATATPEPAPWTGSSLWNQSPSRKTKPAENGDSTPLPRTPKVSSKPAPTSPCLDGRGFGNACGSINGRAKFTEEKVAEMRQLFSEGWSYSRLARHFGCHPNTVWNALTGRTWSHV